MYNVLEALRAGRAAEEAAGTIRWLHPAYQAPAGQTTQTGLNITTKDTKGTKGKASKAKEAWPKPLAERALSAAATQPVPEPGSAALLFGGMLTLLGIRRRRA